MDSRETSRADRSPSKTPCDASLHLTMQPGTQACRIGHVRIDDLVIRTIAVHVAEPGRVAIVDELIEALQVQMREPDAILVRLPDQPHRITLCEYVAR